MVTLGIPLQSPKQTLRLRIDDIGLANPFDKDVVSEIRAIWMRHSVIVFSKKTLTPRQHLKFTKHFGPLQRHTIKDLLHPEFP